MDTAKIYEEDAQNEDAQEGMTTITWKNETRKLGQLIPWERNPRQIKTDQAKRLAESFQEFGQVEPIAVGPDNELYNGHQRLNVLEAKFGKDYEVEVRVSSRPLTEKEREKLTIYLHKGAAGEWDWDALCDFEVPDLIEWGFTEKELQIGGFDLDAPQGEDVHKSLADRFIVPPFSVLDARQGYWQSRKNAWLSIGIKSEIGRGGEGGAQPPHGPTVTQNADGTLCDSKASRDGWLEKQEALGAIPPNEGGDNGILASPGKYAPNGLLGNSKQARSHYASPGGSPRPAATIVDGHTIRGDGKGARLTWVTSDRPESDLDETSRKNLAAGRAVVYGTEGNASEQSGTSIFDPVLCELVYRWFMPSGGAILDPFAGGSVRGIVAAKLGYAYTGIDLRPEQIEANEAQGKEIAPDKIPHWIVGDSQNVKELAPGEYDLIFSCPPYFDLELYSDDPADLSNAGDYGAFIEVYRRIILDCVSMLKENRFACFVVGDIRDKKGFYRNFPADTVQAFEDAGAILYNDAVLVTAVGSLPIRVGRQFQGYRKLGKTHQNVLVFYKGDIKAIKSFGDVECGDVLEGANEIPD